MCVCEFIMNSFKEPTLSRRCSLCLPKVLIAGAVHFGCVHAYVLCDCELLAHHGPLRACVWACRTGLPTRETQHTSTW